MPIDFHCRECDHSGQASDKFAGRIVKCPRCQNPVEIPPPPKFQEVPAGDRPAEPAGFLWSALAWLLLTVGLSGVVGAAAALVGRQFQDALGKLPVWDDGQAAVVGLVIAAGIFSAGLIMRTPGDSSR